ncbi:putative annexin [Schistosoma mansoni]|uniref:putative annexin n=1 Tax=Schistosoma mansoni TaxID=6183 RepID=UPI00022DC36C|nr:putative annexin [Schistosoma mansoni]|eukprot:XP_018651728.1 putative annexin [Schistosoma mansoni]
MECSHNVAPLEVTGVNNLQSCKYNYSRLQQISPRNVFTHHILNIGYGITLCNVLMFVKIIYWLYKNQLCFLFYFHLEHLIKMKLDIILIMVFLKLLPIYCTPTEPVIYGILPDIYNSITDNIIVLPSNKPIHLSMFGLKMDYISHIAFASIKKPRNSSCEHERVTNSFDALPENSFVSTSVISLRELSNNEVAFFLCIRITPTSLPKADSTSNYTDIDGKWIFAGDGGGTDSVSDYRLSFRTTTTLMPLWVQIILIILLFFLSGLFSGLNLGLMSLDKTELKIIESAGSHNEKSYAKAIRPVREKGNLLLCTLLLGNVLVNTSLTILMDDLTGNGLFAVIGSTIGITLLGEIMPQAVCSRNGLAIGAKTLWLTKLFMLLTFPIAFPISFLLDKILGEEIGQVYSREKLGVLIREQALAGTVATDEMNIITGALALTTKTVADVMTPLSDAFMLSYSANLDFHTMNEIFSNGYTRIPVYENDRQNIRSVLNVKDLAFINTDDKVPVSTVCDFYNRSIIIVLDTTNLGMMLKEFRQGRAHMAFVERLVTEGDCDPYREMIGLVTLEDVIEEIIQAEIVDETDILKVKSFEEKYICYSVLQSFLNANIVGECIYNPKDDEANTLYHMGQWSNYAILLLQGRAVVQIGVEGLIFEAGPFLMFGEAVLKRVNELFPNPSENMDPSVQSARLASEARFLPDYTLKACSNLQYLKISAEHYLLARRLTVLHQRASLPLDVTGKYPINLSEKLHEIKSSNGCIDSLHSSTLYDGHDMFQNAWNHHMDRLQKSSLAAAYASTINNNNNNHVGIKPISSSSSSDCIIKATTTYSTSTINTNNNTTPDISTIINTTSKTISNNNVENAIPDSTTYIVSTANSNKPPTKLYVCYEDVNKAKPEELQAFVPSILINTNMNKPLPKFNDGGGGRV